MISQNVECVCVRVSVHVILDLVRPSNVYPTADRKYKTQVSMEAKSPKHRRQRLACALDHFDVHKISSFCATMCKCFLGIPVGKGLTVVIVRDNIIILRIRDLVLGLQLKKCEDGQKGKEQSNR